MVAFRLRLMVLGEDGFEKNADEWTSKAERETVRAKNNGRQKSSGGTRGERRLWS